MQYQFARTVAFCGGVLGVGVTVNFLIRLSFDAWPFLGLSSLLAAIALVTALWGRIKPLWRALIWLGDGLILLYFAYISRFSLGLYLFPIAGLVLLAALMLISPEITAFHRKALPDNLSVGPSSPLSPPSSSPLPQLPDLTLREWEVLKLIAAGKSNQEIANSLVISPNTVRHHVHQLLRKLHCASRTEAATLANSAGWFTSARNENA